MLSLKNTPKDSSFQPNVLTAERCWLSFLVPVMMFVFPSYWLKHLIALNETIVVLQRVELSLTASVHQGQIPKLINARVPRNVYKTRTSMRFCPVRSTGLQRGQTGLHLLFSPEEHQRGARVPDTPTRGNRPRTGEHQRSGLHLDFQSYVVVYWTQLRFQTRPVCLVNKSVHKCFSFVYMKIQENAQTFFFFFLLS